MMRVEGGKMAATKPKKKDSAAQAMARKRWQKTTAAERTAFAKFVASHGAGRPRSTDRCPCGLLTRATARKRNHRCSAPEEGKAQ